MSYRAYAGEYDTRVWIWKNDPDRAANSDGQRPESAKEHCSRKVSIMPARATERFISQQIKADVTHVIRMRRDLETSVITSAYWLTLADGTRFDIRGIFDVDSRKVELMLECNQRTA